MNQINNHKESIILVLFFFIALFIHLDYKQFFLILLLITFCVLCSVFIIKIFFPDEYILDLSEFKELIENKEFDVLYAKLLDTCRCNNNHFIHIILKENIDVLKKFIDHPKLDFFYVPVDFFISSSFEKQKILYSNLDVVVMLNRNAESSILQDFEEKLKMERQINSF